MPQTREHVAILDLLGVPRGVVALTKADLADEEWLALVADDVRALLAPTTLAGSAIVPVSARTGQGLDALREALASTLAQARAREADAPFRLPVDRAFSVKGTGTVITGTVWSGSVARDAEVRLLPAGHVARVRGIESHGATRDAAEPGARTALALAGVDVAQAARGQVVVADAAWAATTRLRADVTLLAGAAPLGPRARVRLHLGTSEVGARVVAGGGAIAPGAARAARLVTDHPVVARGGDRFVLRGGPRLTTIGGGVVTDPQPPLRRTRPFAEPAATPEARAGWMLAEAGATGVAVPVLTLRLGTTEAAVRRLLKGLKAVVREGHAWDAALVAARAAALDRAVRAHVTAHPTAGGAPAAELLARHAGDARFAPLLLAEATDRHGLAAAGALLRPKGWAPVDDPAQAADRAWIADRLRAAGREPPSLAELSAERGHDLRGALKGLEKAGQVVPVEADRCYDPAAFAAILLVLGQTLDATRPTSPSALREVLGVSRKFLMPLLEFCDRRGYTLRLDEGRVRGPLLG
jgi:selenocysteine-specific elongation factor